MKNIAILALFIFASVTVFAQTEVELTKEGKYAKNILIENGINSPCFTVTETPKGTFIGTRSTTNLPINYFYTVGTKTLKKVDYLTGYVLIGYSPIDNSLFAGKYEYGKLNDNMYRKIYSHNLSTKEIKLVYSGRWILDDPTFTSNFDSLRIDNGDVIYVKIK